MNHRDVIPDLHADIARLRATLAALEPGAPLAFLGDFIDAGSATRESDDAAVLTAVRRLIDSGRAVAVMGNHELNAILYHTDGTEGRPLREHSGNNREQHASFLQQFGANTPQARVWTDWFLKLPLWLDLGGLRLVHACWDQAAVEMVAARRPDGQLTRADLPEIAAESTEFGRAVQRLVSGPEAHLGDGHPGFRDSKNHLRHHVRLAWWRPEARLWREAALSVPDVSQLPKGEIPVCQGVPPYPDGAPPVIAGHYKMTGTPRIEAANAACLDYPDTACVYRWRGEAAFSAINLLTIPG